MAGQSDDGCLQNSNAPGDLNLRKLEAYQPGLGEGFSQEELSKHFVMLNRQL